jgi:predicted phosphodiesterase
VLYFNPGSASSARSGGGPSVGRLSVGTSITGRIEPIRPHGPK